MLSAVILIGMTLAVSLITADFLTKTAKQRTQQVRDISKERLDCQFASLYIRNASLNCTNNCSAGINHTVTATVVNSGKKAVQIENLYFRNATGAILTFYTNGTKELNASDVLTLTNTSTTGCGDINRTIDRVIISSINCPNTAFDSMPGSDVSFASCG